MKHAVIVLLECKDNIDDPGLMILAKDILDKPRNSLGDGIVYFEGNDWVEDYYYLDPLENLDGKVQMETKVSEAKPEGEEAPGKAVTPESENFEEDKENIIPFPRLAYAGEEPPEGDNWLERLPTNCIFRAIDKDPRNYMVMTFAIKYKEEDHIVVLWTEAKVEDPFITVHSNRFCNRFDYVDTLSIPYSVIEKGIDNEEVQESEE